MVLLNELEDTRLIPLQLIPDEFFETECTKLEPRCAHACACGPLGLCLGPFRRSIAWLQVYDERVAVRPRHEIHVELSLEECRAKMREWQTGVFGPARGDYLANWACDSSGADATEQESENIVPDSNNCVYMMEKSLRLAQSGADDAFCVTIHARAILVFDYSLPPVTVI
jgi:hypothetical protein